MKNISSYLCALFLAGFFAAEAEALTYSDSPSWYTGLIGKSQNQILEPKPLGDISRLLKLAKVHFIVDSNDIACEYSVRFNENKVDNINANHYVLAEYAQARNGGEIADYIGKNIDELLRLLFNYDEEALSRIEEHIEKYIGFVEEQTSTITSLYNDIADATTTFLGRVDDLIDSYKQGSDLAELQYDALVEQLTIFVNQFSTYFGDISTGQMGEYLQQDKIENFYQHFQGGYENIVRQLEEAEQSAQNKIDIFKEDFNVNNFAMVA